MTVSKLHKTTLESLLNQFPTIKSAIIDLSGVVYNDTGLTPGIQETFNQLQQKMTVMIATNNSNRHIQWIQNRLESSGIPLKSDQIISSGLGLSYDNVLKKALSRKKVYLYGRETAKPYFELCPIYGFVENVDQAECIVVMASLRDDNQRVYDLVKESLLKKARPIICCNPDRYVMGIDGKIKVAGYYAEKLGKECNIKVQWFGKPYKNFSMVLKQKYEAYTGDRLDNSVWFFDDNIENVTHMKTHLGISGCCVTETGLSRAINIEQVCQTMPCFPDALIPQFSLDPYTLPLSYDQ